MDEKDTEKRTYSWCIRFEGFIEIKDESETMPAGYPLRRQIQRAINDVIAQYEAKYRLYDYTDSVMDVDGDGEFESD